jgi:hypothetical protein
MYQPCSLNFDIVYPNQSLYSGACFQAWVFTRIRGCILVGFVDIVDSNILQFVTEE